MGKEKEQKDQHYRKSWDEYFMDLAFTVAERATCPRRHVGAILVKNKKLLGTGYNGSPSGVADCYEQGCLIEHYHENGVEKERCIRTIHAEVNLVLFTNREDREDATVFVTDSPCYNCAKMLANSGIKEVVYERVYEKDHPKVSALFNEAKIQYRQYLRNSVPALPQ
ncbi:cytidine/deoxycytidylate deaminase family protein [Tepidibacillus infernus]|uniref:CMP deaminase n=1 Tax=Tepidibacillus decaturensis TaxID=1413211 RepID=A0A135L7M7_9BACI|nr:MULTISPECIES: dCMP deaminase family protein [Tepidibacillus]KXG44995.1 CMP deaminase [Tepidibacillus decaturensis]GBF10111.1 tRNA-specific adenosine deaminase [Tepidibacillus sp. HK-1]